MDWESHSKRQCLRARTCLYPDGACRKSTTGAAMDAASPFLIDISAKKKEKKLKFNPLFKRLKLSEIKHFQSLV